VKKIGDGVYAAASPDRSKGGSNSGFVVGSDSVLVVDTFVDLTPARELLAEIRKVTDLPVRFVVNTHYHLDHTGGNKVFAEAGATIMAHRNVRTWTRTEKPELLWQRYQAGVESESRVPGPTRRSV
jgi:cyclase